jgi:hypothetical protein
MLCTASSDTSLAVRARGTRSECLARLVRPNRDPLPMVDEAKGQTDTLSDEEAP